MNWIRVECGQLILVTFRVFLTCRDVVEVRSLQAFKNRLDYRPRLATLRFMYVFSLYKCPHAGNIHQMGYYRHVLCLLGSIVLAPTWFSVHVHLSKTTRCSGSLSSFSSFSFSSFSLWCCICKENIEDKSLFEPCQPLRTTPELIDIHLLFVFTLIVQGPNTGT